MTISCSPSEEVLNYGISSQEQSGRVMVTAVARKQLDHPFCGADAMNCGSFKQINRQMEKKGRRHPLNTW